MQLITKAQTELIKTIVVKQDAVNDLSEHIDIFMPRTAWAGDCRSWFKRGKRHGPITAIHPGSRVHWFHALERPKFEDFEYEFDMGHTQVRKKLFLIIFRCQNGKKNNRYAMKYSLLMAMGAVYWSICSIY